MHTVRTLFAVLLFSLSSLPVYPYVLDKSEINGRLTPLRWRTASMPLSFVQNDRPISLLPNLAPNSGLLRAIEDAMRAWEMPPIGMRLNGTVSTLDQDWDGVNLITFADTPKNRDLTANHSALCRTTAILQSNRWRILDADIMFNPKESFATDAGLSRTDIQAVLTHELGHALGLGHSPLISATMFPFANPGDTLARTLSADDLAGVRESYGLDSGPGTGSISGSVVTEPNSPVFGAHVVALSSCAERNGSF